MDIGCGLHVWRSVESSLLDQCHPCEVRHLGPCVAVELWQRGVQWYCQQLQRTCNTKEEKKKSDLLETRSHGRSEKEDGEERRDLEEWVILIGTNFWKLSVG